MEGVQSGTVIYFKAQNSLTGATCDLERGEFHYPFHDSLNARVMWRCMRLCKIDELAEFFLMYLRREIS